ncbi:MULTISPECIES: hypothetical protein [Variovorax]|uniref:hypothetical protein n=1 Tax=Variovorax TaxID=34072 RepID=UPI00285F3A84|nr:hypothetical protein [Variovorax sp. 3319]MDR6890388.1 hypothetical protein [Variovorax sp. 3319]
MPTTIKESEIAQTDLRPFMHFLLLAPGGNPDGESVHRSRILGSDFGEHDPSYQLFITSEDAFQPAVLERVQAAVKQKLGAP